uniref:Uncharacterized protein n=1 Tax=Anguilla anguilla TaxID=7936 RepID=A0A0E9Y0S9_ANGAN
MMYLVHNKQYFYEKQKKK